ncbi:hypothetical protein ACNQGL_07730 [Flavobacterium sp. LB3P21]|uniref:hypothetical protein n=1 Tax=Flavobacterium sp. LB3P21 TaxID=3401719 RepID=UPI003AAD4624
MANKVEILNLDINTDALISKMTTTRAEIDRLKAAQKSLSDSNQTNSDSFTQNEVAIKRLQTSYATQKNVVTQLSTAQTAFATATAAITSAVDKENTSITSARENNKQLLTLRNELNLKTIEGQTALTGINAKLDQNNAYIKENVSGYEKQKIGIGDYRTQITGALQDSGLFGGKIQSVTQSLQGFSGVFGIMKNEVKTGTDQIRNSAVATEGMTLAQKSLAVATGIGTGAMRIFTVALAATGIGLIIAAVALLIGYFKTFDPIVDKLEQGFAALGAAVRVVQQAFASLFSSTQDSSKSFRELGSNMAKAAKDAANLKAAQQDLNDAQKAQEVTNNRASQQYDELILKSKNRTLTEKERIAFLQRADAIETANFKQRSALAEADLRQSIEAARIKGDLSNQELNNLKRNTVAYGTYLLNQGKITDAELDALIKSENGKIAIKAESTKRLEKIANTTDKLNDDAQAKREKASQDAEAAEQKRIATQAKTVDAGIQKNKEAIDLYVSQQGIKKKSVEDELAFEETLLTKKLALVKKEYDSKKISQTAYENESLKLKNDFAKKQVDVTIANAQTELDTYKRSIEQKIVDDTFFTEQKLIGKQNENNSLALKETEFQALRLANGQINETEYNAAIGLINENNRIKNDQATLLFEQAKKDKKVIDLENQRILDEEKFTTDFALQTERERIRYEAELAAANKTGADTILIDQKHALAKKKIDDALQQSKIASLGATLGVVADALGKETAAGKAAALAQALINTYQGISAGVKLGYPMAIPAVAAATLTGFGAVKNIVATKVPTRAEGGIIPTLGAGVINNGANVIPLSNGDNTLAYVKQGEVILNEQQQARAGGSNFFKSLGIPGFNGGGLVGGNTNLGSQNSFKIDIDLLAYKVGQTIRMLPAPVVSVTDISYQQNRVAVIENAANL